MRMAGHGDQLGVIATMYRRVTNGGETRNVNGSATMVRAASVPVAAAQPVAAPSIPTGTTSNVAPIVSLPRPTGITADHLRPESATASRPTLAPGQQAPTVIRPGPSATGGSSGGAGSGAASYGPTEYYGADGVTVEKSAAAKKPSLLPIGLILWALFGT